MSTGTLPPLLPMLEWAAKQEQREALRRHLGRHFDGATYDRQHDQQRLTTQLERVLALMLDGRYRTLAEIRHELGTGSEASISARLRDLRKIRFGAWIVDRRLRGPRNRGLFEYAIRRRGDSEE